MREGARCDCFRSWEQAPPADVLRGPGYTLVTDGYSLKRFFINTISLCITAMVGAVAAADILHLRDGTRHQGEVVRQDDRVVVFRARVGESESFIARSFPVSQVLKIEKGRELPIGKRPDAAKAAAADARLEQMLREGFELLDDKDLTPALRAMQRAVMQAPPEQLDALDQLSRSVRQTPLAELLAQTRIQCAERDTRRKAFEIRNATPFELDVLGRLLETLQGDAMREIFAGRTLAAWAEGPDSYEALQPDAPIMVERVCRAAAILQCRLRFDPRLKTPGKTRAALVRMRDQLSEFAAKVSAMRGFTSVERGDREMPEDDPTLAEAERILADEARKVAEAAAASQPASQPAEEPSSQPSRTEPPEKPREEPGVP